MIRHRELSELAIAHLDCDAFYASVEKRDNPELVARPVIVGGSTRGVVSTACYIARIRGVHSAMPMARALAACPDAVVLRPDMERYAAVGRQIREIMRETAPLVEPLSIDEAFLDLGGTELLHRSCPAETLARLAARIESEIGVSCLDRSQLQQVPCQGGIRPRQAAGHERHRAGRGSRQAGADAGLGDLGCRPAA